MAASTETNVPAAERTLKPIPIIQITTSSKKKKNKSKSSRNSKQKSRTKLKRKSAPLVLCKDDSDGEIECNISDQHHNRNHNVDMHASQDPLSCVSFLTQPHVLSQNTNATTTPANNAENDENTTACADDAETDDLLLALGHITTAKTNTASSSSNHKNENSALRNENGAGKETETIHRKRENENEKKSTVELDRNSLRKQKKPAAMDYDFASQLFTQAAIANRSLPTMPTKKKQPVVSQTPPPTTSHAMASKPLTRTLSKTPPKLQRSRATSTSKSTYRKFKPPRIQRPNTHTSVSASATKSVPSSHSHNIRNSNRAFKAPKMRRTSSVAATAVTAAVTPTMKSTRSKKTASFDAILQNLKMDSHANADTTSLFETPSRNSNNKSGGFMGARAMASSKQEMSEEEEEHAHSLTPPPPTNGFGKASSVFRSSSRRAGGGGFNKPVIRRVPRTTQSALKLKVKGNALLLDAPTTPSLFSKASHTNCKRGPAAPAASSVAVSNKLSAFDQFMKTTDLESDLTGVEHYVKPSSKTTETRASVPLEHKEEDEIETPTKSSSFASAKQSLFRKASNTNCNQSETKRDCKRRPTAPAASSSITKSAAVSFKLKSDKARRAGTARDKLSAFDQFMQATDLESDLTGVEHYVKPSSKTTCVSVPLEHKDNETETPTKSPSSSFASAKQSLFRKASTRSAAEEPNTPAVGVGVRRASDKLSAFDLYMKTTDLGSDQTGVEHYTSAETRVQQEQKDSELETPKMSKKTATTTTTVTPSTTTLGAEDAEAILAAFMAGIPDYIESQTQHTQTQTESMTAPLATVAVPATPCISRAPLQQTMDATNRDQHDNNNHELSPQQIDAMTDEQYVAYKRKLQTAVATTPTFASAFSPGSSTNSSEDGQLLFRKIPRHRHVRLHECHSHKLAEFDAVLQRLSTESPSSSTTTTTTAKTPSHAQKKTTQSHDSHHHHKAMTELPRFQKWVSAKNKLAAFDADCAYWQKRRQQEQPTQRQRQQVKEKGRAQVQQKHHSSPFPLKTPPLRSNTFLGINRPSTYPHPHGQQQHDTNAHSHHNQCQVATQKRKLTFSSGYDSAVKHGPMHKKRKLTPSSSSRDTVVAKHGSATTATQFDMPKASHLSTLKAVTSTHSKNGELVIWSADYLQQKPFRIHRDVVYMTLELAADYRFAAGDDSDTITDILYDDDDMFDNAEHTHNNNSNADVDMLYDDWEHVASSSSAAFDHHLRNDVAPRVAPAAMQIKAEITAANCSGSGSGGGGRSWKHARQCLLDNGCDADLCSAKWVRHHWSLLVWTLCCVERRFAWKLGGLYVNFTHVLQRLRYRYHVEQTLARPSTLKKIYRHDLSSNVLMVLAVSRIMYGANNRVWLTDGWYEMEAMFSDSDTEALVENGELKIGDKLKVCNARKEGLPCEPLDNVAVDAHLVLSRNSIRKARWYAKLGVQAQTPKCPNVFRVSLKSVKLHGGCVPYIYVYIARQYDLQYAIKSGLEKGMYTERAKERRMHEYRQQQKVRTHQLMMQFAREMQLDQYISGDGHSGGDDGCFGGDDGDDNLAARKQIARKIDLLKTRVTNAMSEQQFGKGGGAHQCNVSEFFACKIYEVGLSDSGSGDGGDEDILDAYCTEISVWNPSEQATQIMREGNLVKIYNVHTQNRLCSQCNVAFLSASSQRSKFVKIAQRTQSVFLRSFYEFPPSQPQKVQMVQELGFEFDCLVLVLKQHHYHQQQHEHTASQQTQLFVVNLYGAHKDMMSIHVTQNEQILFFKHIQPHSIYVVRNLKYKGYDQHCGIHTAATYQRSKFIAATSSSVSNTEEYRTAKEFLTSHEGQLYCQEMLQKVNDIFM